MAIKLVSTVFTDEFTGGGGGGAGNLLGSVGDKITATLTFEAFWATENTYMIFKSSDSTVTRQDNGSFIDAGFQVNDTITITGTTSNNVNRTISAITDSVITVSGGALTNERAVAANIYGTTLITAIDFFWNVIANSSGEDYNSLVDTDAVQVMNVQGVNAGGMGLTNLTQLGSSKGYQIGSATIDDVSFANYKQRLVIVHTFYITPLFLPDQLTHVQDKTNPDYFSKDECLKYVFKIGAKFAQTNGDYDHASRFTLEKGVTGWFNEFLNGFDPNYTFSSITYTDVVTATATTALQNNATTDVEIRVLSNSLFTLGQKLVLNVCYLPLDVQDIGQVKTNMIANYRFDRVLLTEGAAAVNGDQNGTDAQTITNAQAIRVSANEMKVIFRGDLAAAYKTFIASKDSGNRNYLIFVTPQKAAVATTIATDRNAVICGQDSYIVNTDDSTLFTVAGSVEFIKNDADLAQTSYNDIKAMVQDTYLANFQFNTKGTDGAVINWMTIMIEAEKTGQTSVVLDETNFAFNGFLPDCSTKVQAIDVTRATNFLYASDDLRSNIRIFRLPGSDVQAAKTIAYQVTFPFKTRWEAWRTLIDASACFPETAGQDWATYFAASGWSIKFNIYAEMVSSAGVVTEFKHTCAFNALGDFNSVSPQGITGTLSVYQIDTTSGLAVDLDGQLQFDSTNNLIKATFTGDFSSFPVGYDTYVGVIRLDSDTVGGIQFVREGYSNVTLETDNPITSVILTKVSNTVIQLDAIIDGTLLSQDIPYYLSARLDLRSTTLAGLLQQTYGNLMTEKYEVLILNP